MKHFLEENNFTKEEIQSIFDQAFWFKENRKARPSLDLKGQSWGMLFYKNSTRTRVSFEVGIRELGGNPILLDLSKHPNRTGGKRPGYSQSSIPFPGRTRLFEHMDTI